MVASVGLKCVVCGRRKSQWSNGELVGKYVGVWVYPMWVSVVVVQKSSRGG